MGETVRHPRALAAFRVVLYAAAAVLVVGFAGVTVAFLLAFLTVTGLAMLVNGTVNVLAVVLVVGLVAVTFGLFAGGLVTGARRVERLVREADRVPDPVEQLKQRYVDAEFGEAEFERRLAVLLAEAETTGGDDGRQSEAEDDAPVSIEVDLA